MAKKTLLSTLRKAADEAKGLAEDQLGKMRSLRSGADEAAEARSAARLSSAQKAKKLTGLKSEYSRTLKSLEGNENLSDEAMDRMMNKLDDLKTRIKRMGGEIPEVPEMRKGGYAKAKMMQGGMANKKKHSYATGGYVKDNTKKKK